jgi:DNA-binding transcriptional LysR family regulator
MVFYEAGVRILDEVDAASEAVRSEAAAPAGRLKVSVPTSFALMWLSPRLAPFIRAHPLLELDLMLNDRYIDIVHDGFDCAIRIATRLPDSSLVARRLGQARRLLVAAPNYLRHAPPLLAPEDLEQHACLLYSQDGGPAEWPLQGTAGGAPLQVRGAFRVNNSVMLREQLLAGLGLTLTPEFVVRDLLDSGALVEVLAERRPEPLTVFGVVAHQRYVAHKVNVFLEFVGRQLERG